MLVDDRHPADAIADGLRSIPEVRGVYSQTGAPYLTLWVSVSSLSCELNLAISRACDQVVDRIGYFDHDVRIVTADFLPPQTVLSTLWERGS